MLLSNRKPQFEEEPHLHIHQSHIHPAELWSFGMDQGNLAARLQRRFFHTFVQPVLETCEM